MTQQDALIIINDLNRNGSRTLPAPTAGNSPPPFIDPTGDGLVTPQDVLVVINELNRQAAAEGEGEGASNLLGAEGESHDAFTSDVLAVPDYSGDTGNAYGQALYQYVLDQQDSGDSAMLNRRERRTASTGSQNVWTRQDLIAAVANSSAAGDVMYDDAWIDTLAQDNEHATALDELFGDDAWLEG